MSVVILPGDCREMLATLADASVHCVVTSPPYWGLRDYGVAGQIGLEQSPDEYVAETVAVFREVRRVLRDDGTLWLNLGDSYASGGGTGAQGARGQRFDRRYFPEASIKPKDLIGIPWMVAFALRADGWYLRSDIIWAKPNPMPESVTDRPSQAHEHVFLFAKSGDTTFWTHRDRSGMRSKPEPDYRWLNRETREERSDIPDGWPEVGRDLWRRINLWTAHDYFFDAEAIREDSEASDASKARYAYGRYEGGGNAKRFERTGKPDFLTTKNNDYGQASGTRNSRNVWSIATKPFADAHFATFPPDLAERCISAGTSEHGCCSACGAPWGRPTERVDTGRRQKMADGWDTGAGGHGTIHRDGREKGESGVPIMESRTIGWGPSCQHDVPVKPCTVLDPFAGAFTTAMVADRLQRNAIGIELNPDYCAMAERRLVKDAGMFAEITA